MMKNPISYFFLLMLSLALVNCSKSNDDVQPKSSEKELTSFAINGVPGSVSEADKTISVALPAGTDVKSFAPAIDIPKTATIKPALDVVQDFSKPVTYTITAEDGTSVTYTVVVTVQSDSTSITANPVIIASSTTVCGGGSTTLTVSNPMVGATYTWSKDSVQIAGAAGATLVVTQAGRYTVVAKVGEKVSQASNAVVVTAGLPANFKPVIAKSSTTSCGGGSVTLTVSNPAVGAIYTWYNNGGVIAGTTGITYVASQAGSYKVVAKLGSCSSPASDTVAVTISTPTNPIPVITATSATLCTGGSTTLTVSNPAAGATYTWFKDGVQLAGTSGNTYNATQAGSYTVVANVGGCSSQASAAVTISAFVNSTQPVITASSPTSCSDTTTVLTVSNPMVGATYTWYNNGGVIVGVTGSSLVATQPGSYWVVANDGSCSSRASNSVVVTISTPTNPKPVITATSTIVCAGGGTTLMVNNPVGSATYTWYKDGVQLASTTSNTYMATQPGDYRVVSIAGGCQSLTSNVVSVVPCVQ